MTTLTNPPSLVKWENLSFLIMDAPGEANLHLYIKELKRHDVKHLVRACESTYSREQVEASGIQVHVSVFGYPSHVQEMEFQDGESPAEEIIEKWLDLVEERVKQQETVAVHCVAGLGRYEITLDCSCALEPPCSSPSHSSSTDLTPSTLSSTFESVAGVPSTFDS